MAVRVYRNVKIGGLTFKSGEFYRFTYENFENDRFPLVFYINTHFGLNEDTGNFHQYIQAINFHYIPYSKRMQFLEKWMKLNENNMFIKSNFEHMWTRLSTNFPYLRNAFRRYLIYPTDIIKYPQHISKNDVRRIVKCSIESDFSIGDQTLFLSKFKDFNKFRIVKKKIHKGK